MRLAKTLTVLLLCTALVAHVIADDSTTASEDVAAAEAPKEEVSIFSTEEQAALKKSETSFEFQAEVTRLMDIIINSLYSNREIFLRELISNAADALDKIRFMSLTDKSVLGETEDLKIEIIFDKTAKTLTIRDYGVGMSRDELIKNLGIVAKSGTTEFVEAAGKDSSNTLSLIGQFGVGFYSVYLVSDRVTVISKSNKDEQHVWQSNADRTFTVAVDPRGNTLGRGTSVTLHLKEDAEEFLNEDKLEKLVGRYSEFINFPISLWSTKSVSEDVLDEEATKAAEEEYAAKKEAKEKAKEEKKDGDDLEVSEEVDDDIEPPKPKMKKVSKDVSDWKQLNTVKAIWTRGKDDITPEEYNNFYKSLTKDKDSEEPLSHIHFTAEGEISFRSILYIPKKAEAGLYDRYYDKSSNLKLFVRRVLIADEFDDFLPRYLNFIRGVVDSEDLPLNVNRETLAQSRVLKTMSKKLTRKVLEMLRLLSEGAEEGDAKKDDDASDDADSKDDGADEKKDKNLEKYVTFWESFGKSIKLGLIDDRSNKSKLTKLLRFKTSKSDGKWVSLDEYVENMKEEQKFIYYITGESIEAVSNSPFLEKLQKRDFEVIYMTDPLDEYVTQALTEHDGNQLMSISKENLKFGDEKADKSKKLKEEWEPFTTWLKGVYGDKVEKVAISSRLVASPCALVTGQYGWTANMERIMKAQTFNDGSKASYMAAKKTMEINPLHPIIRELRKKSVDTPEDKAVTDVANLLYDAALVTSGFDVTDKKVFAERIHRVVGSSLNVDPDAPLADEPEEEEEEVKAEETEQPADDEPAHDDDEDVVDADEDHETHDEL